MTTAEQAGGMMSEAKPVEVQEAVKVAEIVPIAQETGIQKQAVTPMELLRLAMDQNADLAKLEKLMELQLRWEANEAKKSYISAMNAFKADPPEILKNKTASFEGKSGGVVSYDYATLDNVCQQVTRSLSRHDISHRWRIEQQDALIRVTCILTHAEGHSEETTMCAGADGSGTKNAIQAIASTVSYLERYTLLGGVGLAVKGMDNDGQGVQPKMEGLPGILKAIAEAPDTSALLDIYKRAFKEATAQNNPTAMRAIVTAKDARKAALEGGQT